MSEETPKTTIWDDKPFAITNEGYTKPPERKWLLCNAQSGLGVLPLGKVGQIIAAGGVGKTTVCAQLAVAVATGTKWLGTFSVVSPGRVALILGEEDKDEVHRKIYHAVELFACAEQDEELRTGLREADLSNIVAIPLASVPSPMVERKGEQLVNGDFLDWLRAYLLTMHNLKLVILDPLSRFGGEECEVSNAWATRFDQALELIAKENGCTVLIAHHSNQTSRKKNADFDATSGRGVSALVDGARWAMGLMRASEQDDAELASIVTVSCLKSSYAPHWKPFDLTRDDENGGCLVVMSQAKERSVSSKKKASDPSGLKERARIDKVEKAKAIIVAILAKHKTIACRDLLSAVRNETGFGTEISNDAKSALILDEKIFSYREGLFVFYTINRPEPEDNVVPFKRPDPGSPKI